MYDIRQFRPTLYLLLALGFLGFSLAMESAAMGVLSLGVLVLHGWLLRSGRFRPLPRWLAGLITTLLFIYTATALWQEAQTRAVFVLGQFLVFLQIVKLFEIRGNRDYAQLIVLTVLLVVAAAINSASLIFGIVFIIHIFLTLYVCLLFHLKLETDQAKAMLGLSEDNVPPETLRQDQRYLGRSMRRLTMLVSVVSVAMAVVVFLFFPRGTGANVFSPLQSRPSQSLTGFSDEVSFQNIAQITQNTARVAYVRLLHNNQPVQGTMPLLLRGRTYNVYTGNDTSNGAPWQWRNRDADKRTIMANLRPDEERPIAADYSGDTWRQQVTLEPNGSKSLFMLAGPVSFGMNRDRAVYYHAHDETLEMQDPLNLPLRYEVVSRGRLDPILLKGDLRPAAAPRGNAAQPLTLRERAARLLGGQRPPRVEDEAPAPAFVSRLDPLIAETARKPEVSGSDDSGPLAPRRPPTAAPSELDLQIAQNIESYLRQNFQYTLDLTDVARISNRDPIAAFLTDFKKGHCEYFAGAMTLMLQSLGIEARLVTGFRCDEYNSWGEGYYIVRQSHAHAWVEVRGPEGWETFDPTSSRMADGTTGEKTVWQQVQHAFNYLEYMWAESVVAYDRDSRNNLINTADAALVNTAGQTTEAAKALKERLTRPSLFYSVSERVMTGLVLLMIGFSLVVLAWFVFDRWKLRQRARRIGLDALPKSEQLRLARQLAFYDRLTQLLEARGIHRPAHITPMEFSQSISFLPPAEYDLVHRLTQVFYRVRYGNHEVSPAQQRRLAKSVDTLTGARS